MLRANEIGGGTVRRTFRFGDAAVFAGKTLTAEQILAMPEANRRALIEKGYIVVYPKPPETETVAAPAKGKRHVVATGFGRYDVIEGRKLNKKALTKEEAQALAGVKDKH